MKSKDIKSLQNKELGELRKQLSEVQTELAGLRLEHSMYKLKNTSSLSNKRKEVAVILSIMKAKERTNGKNA